MPTTQQMIQRAEDLERRAQALRLAAAEMADQMAANKAPLFPGALDQAIALRRQQRATTTTASTNGHAHAASQNGAGPAPAAAGGASGGGVDREAVVRATLADGPQPSPVIREALAAQGEEISSTWISQGILRKMPDVRMVGRGNKARWALKSTRTRHQPAATEPRVTPRKRAGTPKKHYGAKVKAKRALTAALFAKVTVGETYTTTSLAEAGLTLDEIRQIGSLTRYGYFKHKGDGYLRTAKVYTP